MPPKHLCLPITLNIATKR